MVFNEILIPQDSFTETNVTRKKSIVGKFPFIKDHNEKIYFLKKSFLPRLDTFYSKQNDI